jgi:indole-3-glycerol phosphate synthase
LNRIVDLTRSDVGRRQAMVLPDEMERRARSSPAPRPFARALGRGPGTAVIAELKASSPSAGRLVDPYNPAEGARAYERAGVRALSVLTEPHFFGGRLEHIAEVRAAVSLPVLRKDFILDPYQVCEARVSGADAVLLIARLLPEDELAGLLSLAASLGLDALVEIHTAEDMARARAAGASFIGINSRDLDDLSMDAHAFERLAPLAPPGSLLVAESGIKTAADVKGLRRAGARAVLVGESLLKEKDLEKAARRLVEAGKVISHLGSGLT